MIEVLRDIGNKMFRRIKKAIRRFIFKLLRIFRLANEIAIVKLGEDSNMKKMLDDCVWKAMENKLHSVNDAQCCDCQPYSDNDPLKDRLFQALKVPKSYLDGNDRGSG